MPRRTIRLNSRFQNPKATVQRETKRGFPSTMRGANFKLKSEKVQVVRGNLPRGPRPF